MAGKNINTDNYVKCEKIIDLAKKVYKDLGRDIPFIAYTKVNGRIIQLGGEIVNDIKRVQ